MPDINLNGHVWPEDTGTGTAGGNEDWNSAGYIGGMHARDNAINYVEKGLTLTVDYVTPAFDLSAGLAFVEQADSVPVQEPIDDATTYSGSWDQGVALGVDVDAETGIALTDAATNYIFLAVDLASNDSHYIHVDTDNTPPTDPSIKIAEVDTSSDTKDEDFNRAPTATFEEATARTAYSDTIVGEQRLEQMYEANRIRQQAGIPEHVEVGIQSGVTVGLSNAGALVADSRIVMTSESEVSTEADSGTGTESDPYVIRDRDLDNSEATANAGGIVWDDPDATYYLKLINCKVGEYPTDEIKSNTGTELIVQNCLVYSSDSSSYGINREQGDIFVDRCEIAGCGEDGLVTRGGSIDNTYKARNVKFTESQVQWESDAKCIQFLNDTTVDLKYMDATNVNANNFVALWGDIQGTIANVHVQNNQGAALYAQSSRPGTQVNDGLTIEYWHTESTGARTIDIEKDGNLTVRYCYFDDTPDNTRVVLFQNNGAAIPEDIVVEYCRFRKVTGSGGAGEECLESFNGKNVIFRYCWVEECTEDAFEHVNHNGGCEIHHVVGDNVAGQIADYFGTGDGAGGSNYDNTNLNSEVHHVYGDCGSIPLVITDANGVRCLGHIHATSGSRASVEIEQRNSASGQSPNNVEVIGPLSRAEEVPNGTVFNVRGTVGANNFAIYFDGEQIQTYDPDGSIRSGWTTIR